MCNRQGAECGGTLSTAVESRPVYSSLSFCSASAAQQRSARYALSFATLNVAAKPLLALLKVQPTTLRFALRLP